MNIELTRKELADLVSLLQDQPNKKGDVQVCIDGEPLSSCFKIGGENVGKTPKSKSDIVELLYEQVPLLIKKLQEVDSDYLTIVTAVIAILKCSDVQKDC